MQLEIMQSRLSNLHKKFNESERNLEECEYRYGQAKRQFEEMTRELEEAEERSFAYFIRSVIGSQERKIEKEKQELIDARYDLDRAAEQLEEEKANYVQLEFKVIKTTQELEELKELLALNDPSYQGKVDEESEKRIGWRQELVEIEEAYRAGETILNRIEEALGHLDSAQGWSTMDMVGGGFFTDIMKYDKIDRAEELMSKVESELRRYQLELKDVSYEWDNRFEFLSGGHRAMDMFFDNIFTDVSNYNKIRDNISSLEILADQIMTVQNKLTAMEKEVRERIAISEQLY